MARQDEPRARVRENAKSDSVGNSKVVDAVFGDERSEAVGNRGQEGTEPSASDRDVEVVVESEEERESREHAEWLAAVDDTEIVDGGSSSTSYRRANAVFDEGDPQLQLAEFYTYADAEYERNGRF